jgi:cell wall-associated NlpC family hydrolase
VTQFVLGNAAAVVGFRLPITRSAWVQGLLAYQGTPYQHQGRLPGVALDCVGPLIVRAREVGIKPAHFDVTGYSPSPDGSLQPILDEHLIRKPRAELTLGDVVLNRYRLGQPQHVAIIVGTLHGEHLMLHANQRTGKVQVERIPYDRSHYGYVQGYQVPGVVDG